MSTLLKISFYFTLLLSLQNVCSALKENLFAKFKRNNLSISVKVKKNESLHGKKGTIYTIKKGCSSTQYFELRNEEVDSVFINEYLAYNFKQACGIANRTSSVFFNFRYEEFTYVRLPCRTCSDFFLRDCFEMKKTFNAFLEKLGIIELLF